jgi:cysteinyl-tRNA synthetase
MSIKYLGKTFDIHTGGEDNIFPHHESEIAQSETATGKRFVNFWFHPRFLKIEGQKMSKSLKNFFTLSDVEKKGVAPLALRYLFLTSHYRSPFNFTWQGLSGAQTALDKLYENFISLKNGPGKVNKKYIKLFLEAVNDDLNSPKAISVVWALIKDKKIKDADKKKTLLDFDKVLGLNLAKIKKASIPSQIKKLAEEREKARQEKNWQKADELRKEIEKLGYRIEDTEKGPKIKNG